MGGAPTPKWDPIGFDPQPYGCGSKTILGVNGDLDAHWGVRAFDPWPDGKT